MKIKITRCETPNPEVLYFYAEYDIGNGWEKWLLPNGSENCYMMPCAMFNQLTKKEIINRVCEGITRCLGVDVVFPIALNGIINKVIVLDKPAV